MTLEGRGGKVIWPKKDEKGNETLYKAMRSLEKSALGGGLFTSLKRL